MNILSARCDSQRPSRILVLQSPPLKIRQQAEVSFSINWTYHIHIRCTFEVDRKSNRNKCTCLGISPYDVVLAVSAAGSRQQRADEARGWCDERRTLPKSVGRQSRRRPAAQSSSQQAPQETRGCLHGSLLQSFYAFAGYVQRRLLGYVFTLSVPMSRDNGGCIIWPCTVLSLSCFSNYF